jgi:predicted TIM-barrel fold metal-dependent hydrolase
MSTLTRYDAHCHIFTLKYVLKEAKSMLRAIVHNEYPWRKSGALMGAKSHAEQIARFRQILIWLFELTSAALTTERRNLNFLQRQARRAFPGDRLSIIPLMMDVFFILSYDLNKDEDNPEDFETQSGLRPEASIEGIWADAIEELREHILSIGNDEFSKREALGMLAMNEVLDLLESERAVNGINGVIRSTNSTDYYHTEGFDYHMNQLMDLVWTRRGELYPFVAVDPRRKGMIETVMTGKFFTGSRRFYGVKLYPRLGYHPECKPLLPLYQYCSDNGIPITFHCGMSGFPPGIDWKWAHYGNPLNFEPIVQRFPNLRINFAHMGSNDPNHDWERTIVRLINTYDNVFTDLSCYTNFDELNAMLPYWQNNPRVQERLMYGTDFDVMFFTGNRITLQTYMENFKSIFGNDLVRMMVDNPKTFLGVEERRLTCLQKIIRRVIG